MVIEVLLERFLVGFGCVDIVGLDVEVDRKLRVWRFFFHIMELDEGSVDDAIHCVLWIALIEWRSRGRSLSLTISENFYSIN